MPKPQYSGDHLRVRAAFVAAYCPGVTACAIGGERLTAPPRLLDLAHETTADGTPTGRWLGLSCRRHNRSANAWGRLSRGAAGPERVREVSRRSARQDRKEFDSVQRMLAADETVVADDQADASGRDW